MLLLFKLLFGQLCNQFSCNCLHRHMLTYPIRTIISVYTNCSLLMCIWQLHHPRNRFIILFRVWSWGGVRIKYLVWQEFVLLGVRLLRRLLQLIMHDYLGSQIYRCGKSVIFYLMSVHCLFSKNCWWWRCMPQQYRIDMPRWWD